MPGLDTYQGQAGAPPEDAPYDPGFFEWMRANTIGRLGSEEIARTPSPLPPWAIKTMQETAPALTLSAFLGARHYPHNKRTLAALERAQAIKADPGSATTPGGRTEKAFKAGGQYGGWDEIPVRMGPDGKPETEWSRYVKTFDPKQHPFTEASGFQRSPYPPDRGWLGWPKEKAKGRLGDLVNLNPELLKFDPTVADIPTRLERTGKWNSLRGGYAPPGWFRGERLLARGSSNADLKDTLVHEITHVLDERQGYQSGSNPALEKRPWVGKKEAFDRYEENVGEGRARLAQKIEENKPYSDYAYLPEFPGIEFPKDAQGKPIPGRKGRIVERDIGGMRPQEMPPSWQFDRDTKSMRNRSSAPASIAANAPWSMAKWGGGVYGLGKAIDWVAAKGRESKEDEAKAFQDRPQQPSRKAGPMYDYLKDRAKQEADAESAAKLWALGQGGIGATNVLGMVAPGMPLPLRAVNAIGAAWNAQGALGSLKDGHDAQKRQQALLRAQKAWDDINLPDRDESELPPER